MAASTASRSCWARFVGDAGRRRLAVRTARRDTVAASELLRRTDSLVSRLRAPGAGFGQKAWCFHGKGNSLGGFQPDFGGASGSDRSRARRVRTRGRGADASRRRGRHRAAAPALLPPLRNGHRSRAPGGRVVVLSERMQRHGVGVNAREQIAATRDSKQSSVAEVRAALVFARSRALAEYGGSPDLHYYVMEGRHPSALTLLSDHETRLSVGEEMANLATRCDRGNALSKAAGRMLRASRTSLLNAFGPTTDPATRS